MEEECTHDCITEIHSFITADNISCSVVDLSLKIDLEPPRHLVFKGAQRTRAPTTSMIHCKQKQTSGLFAMFNKVLSSLPAKGGEHDGWCGGFSACWTGGFCNPVSRCVPVIRETEGPQQPQPDCTTGTYVSATYWLMADFSWLTRHLKP